jgi:alpha-N-acetylglucosamine transferase
MIARFPRLVAISILALLVLAWLFRGESAPSFPGKPSYRSNSDKKDVGQPEAKLKDTYDSNRKNDPNRVHLADVPDESASATVTSEAVAVETKFPVISRKSPFAYVLWATSDIYACSALILLRRLNEFNSPHRTHVLISEGVSKPYRDEFEKWNATLHDVEPPQHPNPSIDSRKARLNETSEMNLMKLHVFRMHQIDGSVKRAMILDADQYIYGPLDTLFSLPEVDLAAPRAYWNTEAKGGVTFNLASTLMVVEPNDRIWNKVNDGIKDLSRGEYADTVVNRVFSDSAMVLPGVYGTVDDHWYNWWMPAWFRPEEGVLGKGMVEQYHKGEMKEIWRVINLHVNNPQDEVEAEDDGNVDIDLGVEDAAAAPQQMKKRSLTKRQEESEDAEEEEVVEDEEEEEGDLGEELTPEEAEKEKKESGIGMLFTFTDKSLLTLFRLEGEGRRFQGGFQD